MFFEGFTLTTTQVPGGAVRYRRGGSGPPLLLLHRQPRRRTPCGTRSPPALAKHYTVICPDLRGYGGSEKPPATPRPRALRQDPPWPRTWPT
ncbi:MAG: alpha/beta fold hydrolase [Acetobacteraceae bacterium]